MQTGTTTPKGFITSTNSSQSSTLEPVTDSEELVVLESSPSRPGSSKVARLSDVYRHGDNVSNGMARLSSFYFNGKRPINKPAHSLSVSSSESASAIDLTQMEISGTVGESKVKIDTNNFTEAVGKFKCKDQQHSSIGDGLSLQITGVSRKRSRDNDKSARNRQHLRKSAVKLREDSNVSASCEVEEIEDEVIPPPGAQKGRKLLQRRRLDTITKPSPVRMTLVRRPVPPPKRADVLNAINLSDFEDEDDLSDDGFKRSFKTIEPYVMQLFNYGTSEEISAKTGAKPEEVKTIKELRPFDDIDDIEHQLRRNRGVRLAIFNQYRDTLLGHHEVENVICQCSDLFTQFKISMGKAGVENDDVSGTLKISDTSKLVQPKMIAKAYLLKHYQLEGVQWLDCLCNAEGSGILADEMGLGKTFQVIAFLCKGIEAGTIRGPSIVICPSSTLNNWLNECAKFAPTLRVVAYYGSQPERISQQMLYEDESSYDVMVTTYNVATGNKMDRAFLRRRQFHSMILDEGHMVKNCMSSRYKWLMQIRTPFRLLLTGTPLQNNLQELVSLLTFILPKVFEDSRTTLTHAFKNKSSAPAKKRAASAAAASGGTIDLESDEVTVVSSTVTSEAQSPAPSVIAAGTDDDNNNSTAPSVKVGPVETRHIEQAKRLLRPFVLRRCKKDVLGDLPLKTESVVQVELTERQRALYVSVSPTDTGNVDQTVSQRLKQMEDINAVDSTNKKTWITSFMDMRKVANHPLLMRGLYEFPTLRKMAKALMSEDDYVDANHQYVLEDMEMCSDFELHNLCTKYRRLQEYKLPDSALLDSGKILELKQIVDRCVQEGEKVLVFSQFTTMLDILEAVMKMWEVGCCRLDGQTKVDERQALIDDFNTDEDGLLRVFLLSTKAGGFGINLTSANVVVIFDAGNNPSEERQAEDRAHRVGQTKDVRVYKLIGSSTIDEDILENSRSKQMVEHMFWF